MCKIFSNDQDIYYFKILKDKEKNYIISRYNLKLENKMFNYKLNQRNIKYLDIKLNEKTWK